MKVEYCIHFGYLVYYVLNLPDHHGGADTNDTCKVRIHQFYSQRDYSRQVQQKETHHVSTASLYEKT